jgi:L-fucose isomerase-like protein
MEERMKHRIRLGIACLARDTFDLSAATAAYRKITEEVRRVEEVDWEIATDLLQSPEDARRAAGKFASSGLDGLVCVSGTFHLGHLALELRKRVAVPFLLWGLDEPPYNGGKIRLNSVCGVNLDASNLYKSGIDDYRTTFGEKIDEAWIDALRVIAALRSTRVGIAGYRAHGFFNLGVADPGLFGGMGVLLDHFELREMYEAPVAADRIESRRAQLVSVFDAREVSETQVAKVAELAARIDGFCQANGLDALAIRCWPEFARDFGVAPCAAMSLLQSEGRILACEGDVEGALSMIAHRALGAETPFLFDFSQVDFAANHALFWHCGVAPCNLWDGASRRSLDTYFAGGRGVTADFVLKPGELSVARIDTARGATRLFLQHARGVPMEQALKGTYLKAVFDRPVREVLELIVTKGIAHHASMVYGDYREPLRIAAGLKRWEIVE